MLPLLPVRRLRKPPKPTNRSLRQRRLPCVVRENSRNSILAEDLRKMMVVSAPNQFRLPDSRNPNGERSRRILEARILRARLLTPQAQTRLRNLHGNNLEEYCAENSI